jgi:hypothetical protein
MNVQEIRQIATQVGVKPGKMNKTLLVRTIQRQEGNFDCFASAIDGQCDQDNCLWRKDCFTISGKGRQS